MAFKVINASDLRVGGYMMIDSKAHAIRKMDISKTGKHGHAKCRFEAVDVMTGKKKVMVVPGHDKFEVPMIEKKQAQVLSIGGGNANLMDSVSFETFDLPIPEELKEDVKDGITVEYWDIEGDKLIKRKI